LPTVAGAQEGLFMMRAAPPASNGDPTGAGSSIIDSDTGVGTGWRYNTDYQFRILYTTDLIRVYINGVLKLEATPANAGLLAFNSGQFGFTNASQANVLFGNVREADATSFDTAPVASDDMFYYGVTWGAGYDGTNVFDTDVDARASGILDNDYDPDGDAFTLQVGGVNLSTPAASTTIAGTQGGSFTVYGNGRFVYTAASDYQTRGPYQDTFDYTLVDEDGTHTATVTVTVQETNTTPNDISLTDLSTGSTSDIRIGFGAAADTQIATVGTIETNPGELDQYDYELENASNGAFAIKDNKLVVRDTTALNASATHTIVIRSTDVEGQSVSRTFTIHVDPNQAPTSANAAVSANANTAKVFGLADFPFSDADGDSFASLLITSVPTLGVLFVDLDDDGSVDGGEQVQVNFNDVVSRAQLVGGELKYLLNTTSDTTDTFGFKVGDGAAYTASASTMTVTVVTNPCVPDPNSAGCLAADSDGDGLSNAQEDVLHTDRNNPDTDGDGANDGGEAGGNPSQPTDTDRDGIPDVLERGNNDADSDGVPDASDPDSDNDGIPDSAESNNGLPRDTDYDGTPDHLDRDSDGDGILDTVDPAPLVPDPYVDSDGDGIVDVIDLDRDNDGIRDSIESAGDADGDGVPNLADRDSDNDGIPDVVEAGGADVDGNGIADNSADANNNGLADSYESAAGGTALPVADSDDDGTADYLDSDSDGDSISDMREGRVDTDNDGKADYLDSDSDGDGVSDRNEGTADSDGDGVADYMDQPGKLSTAVSGTGSFSWMWIGALLGLAALRRKVHPSALAVVAVVGVAGFNSSETFASDTDEHTGVYVAADVGMSWLEPEDRGGGYVVDDDRSEGWRLLGGYSWSPRWSAELFYIDAGKAGIGSDNAAVGHLGELEYEMYGAGIEWRPLGIEDRLYPTLKVGVASIENSVTDSRINFDRENSLSFYFGVGGAWRFDEQWSLQAEWVSYDRDASFLSLGVRKRW
jgi:hypothetical protein